LALGIAALVREQGIAATFLRDDAGGAMFRRLALPVVVISLVLGSIRLFAQNAGYFDTAFGTAARTLAEVVLLLTLLWWTAESLSRSEARARDTSNVKAENETLRRIAIAQEAERRRIARDVHDHIGQSLTAVRLKLDSLEKKIGLDSEFSDEMSRTCEQAKKLDADVSLLVWQMRPGVLDSHGLASALNSFVREWSVNHGIDAEFHATSSERRLPAEIETNLYRIIQEALNNILKHANATKVSITMNYLSDEAILVIEDNGAGFDTEALIHTTEGSGFGLIGMRERALLVGGKLEIESTPGDGTAIHVRVPRATSTRTLAASNGSRK
jgi:signal transduction histidine kinase